MPTIKNQQILPILWDALIEAGYKVHQTELVEFLYVQYAVPSIVICDNGAYALSLRSCLNLAQNNRLSETVTTLAKMLLSEYYKTF